MVRVKVMFELCCGECRRKFLVVPRLDSLVVVTSQMSNGVLRVHECHELSLHLFRYRDDLHLLFLQLQMMTDYEARKDYSA